MENIDSTNSIDSILNDSYVDAYFRRNKIKEKLLKLRTSKKSGELFGYMIYSDDYKLVPITKISKKNVYIHLSPELFYKVEYPRDIKGLYKTKEEALKGLEEFILKFSIKADFYRDLWIKCEGERLKNKYSIKDITNKE